MSTTKESQWPPKSPYEALLSSPSGRSKVRRCYDAASPSPSPLKKSSIAPNTRKYEKDLGLLEDDNEDDEETLQLKLQAIEAKLKLKKLQQKKAKDAKDATSKSVSRNEGLDVVSSGRKESFPPGRQGSSNFDDGISTKSPARNVQIQASPLKKSTRPPQEQRSPGRVLFGIDKGLKGRDISLRRPANGHSRDEYPFLSEVLQDNESRKRALPSDLTSFHTGVHNKPISFSERIAETRKEDKAQKEKEVRLHEQRSSGFGIPQKEIDSHRNFADKEVSTAKLPTPMNHRSGREEFSRDQIMTASSKVKERTMRRIKSCSSSHPGERPTPTADVWRNPNAEPEISQLVRTPSNVSKRYVRSPSPHVETVRPMSREENPTSDSLFEPFSSLHLSKRQLPHDLLTKTLSKKSLLLLPDLLSAVKSPHYCLPDHLEADFVILAIIASKSNPLSHQDAQRKTANTESSSHAEAVESEQNTKGKYMILTLTDLKWTIDLFLFTTAYTRFRKLIPGSVVALLNPSIMPPPPGKADTGRFSLTLNSSDDTVLEVGTSRDLGWCKSVRKDGKYCSDWIDKRHTEFCEFHVDRAVERTRRGRMEVQGLSAPFAPGGRKRGRTGHFSGGGGGSSKRGNDKSWPDSAKDDGFLREGAQYDQCSSSRYFIGPAISGRSAAQLFDAEGGFERGGNNEERVRKRLAVRGREIEIARRLGERGNGAGSDYLRVRNGDAQQSGDLETSSQAGAVDALSLGLTGNKASSVHLSPIRKRKAGDALECPSMRMKTRFVTEKGIREAGRESLGGAVLKERDDEDDEDLEIC